MQFLIIYPGRFHPFHLGHKASYDYLANKYGQENVYIATSDVQAPVTSPFSFSDKTQMMTKLGIPSSRVVRVKNPYQAQEITDSLSPEQKENTALIFAVSEKDMLEGSARFRFGTKKNGEPTYLQPMPESLKQLKPMSKHAYVAVTPTVDFKVQGQPAQSASQIRQMYVKANDAQRDKIIADLYGEVFPELRDTFDRKLATVQQVKEAIHRIKNTLNESGVRWLEKVLALEKTALEEHSEFFDSDIDDENPDYLEEKWSQKYKRSINCARPRGFSQRAHCQGRKKKS